MICKQCGATLDATDQFCRKCGLNLNAQTNYQPSVPQTPPVQYQRVYIPTSRRMLISKVIAGSIALVIGIIVVMAFYQDTSSFRYQLDSEYASGIDMGLMIGGVIALVGLISLIIGLIGKPVETHAYYGNIGTGYFDRNKSGSWKCPECGKMNGSSRLCSCGYEKRM